MLDLVLQPYVITQYKINWISVQSVTSKFICSLQVGGIYLQYLPCARACAAGVEAGGENGVVAWWEMTLANRASHRPLSLYLQTFQARRVRRRFLPATDRPGALSAYTPHCGVWIMLIIGLSQSEGSILGLFCLRVLKLIWTTI